MVIYHLDEKIHNARARTLKYAMREQVVTAADVSKHVGTNRHTSMRNLRYLDSVRALLLEVEGGKYLFHAPTFVRWHYRRAGLQSFAFGLVEFKGVRYIRIQELKDCAAGRLVVGGVLFKQTSVRDLMGLVHDVRDSLGTVDLLDSVGVGAIAD